MLERAHSQEQAHSELPCRGAKPGLMFRRVTYFFQEIGKRVQLAVGHAAAAIDPRVKESERNIEATGELLAAD